ncbi:MAG: sensor histidine kinase [Desulfotignum sp.]
MQNHDLSPDRNGIAFFGTLSAAVTHDMKNFLAIINENAGLLGDLAARAQNGPVSIDPRKAALISEKIRKQVHRADGMIKQFNRFSHSMDHAQETVDMEEMVHLVAGLAERIIRHHNIFLTVTTPPVPCRIQAHRFDLLHLIFRAVEITCEILDNAPKDTQKHVTVSFGSNPLVPEICFMRDTTTDPGRGTLFENPKDRALLDRVNLHVKTTDTGNGFCLCKTP